MSRKTLTTSQAEDLLPDGQWLHVFRVPGHPDGEQWSRQRVLERFRIVGVELAGDEAVKHQHGLASVGEDTVFVQMRTERK